MNKTNLSRYDNSWYNTGGGALKRLMWYFCNVMIMKNGWIPSPAIKAMALKAFGARLGKGVVVKPCVNIKYPWNLEVGDYTWIGENVWIDNLVKVKIGCNACLSQGAMLLCGNHNFKKETFDLIVGEITLEDGCWIGAQSTVCPGVTCHEHSVLAVNSVASKDMEAYGIYRGNPAVKVGERKIQE
ncbi:MAG: WcaF family extracellular polysaccharide biosynthesis acetyltransferase [Prevotella sp.]|nr:WcaF family extracellular polysaccharide biosynthesis acetyltransferase [Prevotella sp.]